MTTLTDKHSDNKSKVSIWVETQLVTKWDSFCENAGTTRTRFLIEAANERAFAHQSQVENASIISRLVEDNSRLQDKVFSLYEELSRIKSVGLTGVFEPMTPEDIKKQVLDYIQKHPNVAPLDIQIEKLGEGAVMTALSSLLKDKLVTSRNGRFSA